nr:transcription initiation factor iie subunit alpha [Quercus suber]
MAQLAVDLIRMTARAFCSTEHIIVLEALIHHSTLHDGDLAHVLNMQTKPLRKLCGKLREDGLLSVQTRGERRTDGSGSHHTGPNGQLGKERLVQKDWYYLNYHRAIDSIKWRMWKLNKHVETMGAPLTEKKELACPRCKSQWTAMEAIDKLDPNTGNFECPRCEWPALEDVDEDDTVSENETMKRLIQQLGKIFRLLQDIDGATVPENDFATALSNQKPVYRSDIHPASRTEAVDLPNKNLQDSKGLEVKPEKIAVQLQNDEDVKREAQAAEAQSRKEKEAKQNQLPDWIAKSTVSGDITAVGAKEEKERREREANAAIGKVEDDGEKKPAAGSEQEDVMAAYWAELANHKQQEAADARAEEAEEEEEDDDEDEFEDVYVASDGANGASADTNGTGAGHTTNVGTPQLDSSNATDDERDAKRVKTEHDSASVGANGVKTSLGAAGTPAASDEDDDELEFENV